MEAAGQRREGNYWSNEGVFAGTITVAAAGVRNSPEGGLIGSILAAGSALFSSHYALEVQAKNYEAGAEAMRCIHGKLSDVG